MPTILLYSARRTGRFLEGSPCVVAGRTLSNHRGKGPRGLGTVVVFRFPALRLGGPTAGPRLGKPWESAGQLHSSATGPLMELHGRWGASLHTGAKLGTTHHTQIGDEMYATESEAHSEWHWVTMTGPGGVAIPTVTLCGSCTSILTRWAD